MMVEILCYGIYVNVGNRSGLRQLIATVKNNMFLLLELPLQAILNRIVSVVMINLRFIVTNANYLLSIVHSCSFVIIKMGMFDYPNF